MRRRFPVLCGVWLAGGGLLAAPPLGFGDIAGRGRDAVAEGAACCVTGVVTFASPQFGLSGVLAEAGDPNGPGLWFAGEVNNLLVARLAGAERLAEGQVVEVRGIVSRLGFAPGLKAETLTVLGEAPLPPAPLRRLHELDWGVMDNRRVALEGVLMDVRAEAGAVRLQLASDGGTFVVRTPGEAAAWRGAVDAVVRAEGVAMSVFNIRGEFIGVQVEAPGAGAVRIVSPPPAEADIPEMSPGAILPYSPQPPDAHRRRVRGTVTYLRDGDFLYLQAGDEALRVRTDTAGLKTGDAVEAVGFPQLKYGLGSLLFAQVRRVGEGARPAPAPIGWIELSSYPVRDDGEFENFDARLVTVEGRLVSLVRDGSRTRLALEVAGMTAEEPDVVVSVEMEGEPGEDVRRCAAARPLLAVTGILSISQEPGLPQGRLPAITDRRLFVAGAADVRLVRDDAWRRWRRTATARGLAEAGLGLGVAVLLALLVRFIRYRRDYRRLDILTRERKRMAGDLHDTIEQSLVAAKMLLKTAVSLSPETPDGVKETLGTVQEILMSAKAEIRETIFNLRSDELFRRRPEEVLRSLAARLSQGGVVRVRTHLRGLPAALPAARLSDLLFIVQEAVTNAVKHGRAKRIILAADPLREAGFVLRVLNDGAPFDPAAALGPEAGHFGLSGMRERARRSGIGFSLGMDRGFVTVRLEVRT